MGCGGRLRREPEFGGRAEGSVVRGLEIISHICDNTRMQVLKDIPCGFSPAQYEVVNMLSCIHSDSDIAELKTILVKFLNVRMQHELDRLYDVGTLSDDRMNELARQHLRTSYRARP